jgi:glucose/arabinose dehydrogenase
LSTVQIFNKFDSTWKHEVTLISDKPSTKNNFGLIISFSPDGNILAVGEISSAATSNKNAGLVQLFKKDKNKWISSYRLTSAIASVDNYFGSAISFSPDGEILLIGEGNGDIDSKENVGVVNIFNLFNLR